LWAVLALALLLRLYKLDAPLWFDEIATLINYVRAPFGRLIADYSSFNNHLFYSLQAKLSVMVFGESAWAMRLPAVLFGVGSIWLTWRLARLYSTPSVALLAAALLTLSYHHIWFSQNARGYTELMFWSLAALATFEANRQSGDWRRWILFAVCLAGAMYTHLTAAFYIAALGLTWLLTLAARRFPRLAPAALAAPAGSAQWTPLLGFVLGGVITLILCAPALPQMVTLVSGVDETIGVDVMREYRSPIWSIVEGVRTLAGGNPLMMAGAPFAVIVMLIGAVSLWKRAPVFVLVAALQIPITLIALSIVSMRVWPRFFFTEFAFACVLIAEGAFVLATFLSHRAHSVGLKQASANALYALGAGAMLIVSAMLAARNYALPKQNLPGPIALLAAEGANAASVGVLGWAHVPYLDYYKTGWRQIIAPKDLESLSPTGGSVFVVTAFPERTSRANADVWSVLEKDFDVVKFYPGSLGDGGIFVFRSKNQRAETTSR
jgi:hypothetical protein